MGWYCGLPVVATLVMLNIHPVVALDNGLARTPPLGWQSGERFFCNTDCLNYPDDCISETLVKTMADVMAKNGFKDAGYQYVSLSDCWMARTRDSGGRLQADSQRFPSGMKALADYIHQKGLKLGVYLDIGDFTCNGYPGSKDHLKLDAQTVVSWGVDMVEMDGCNVSDSHSYDQSYPQFGSYLNQTGRPVLFICDYPMYQKQKGIQPNFDLVAKTCNIFRTHGNMIDSWDSLHDTLKYFGDNIQSLKNYSKPGSWMEPDNVLVGNFGLSNNQQLMQMAVWSVMASPILVSADLRRLTQVSSDILLNKAALAINQDPLGALGLQVDVIDPVKIWKRPILPKGSFALALLYENISGGPTKFSVTLNDIGMHTAAAYDFYEVFTGINMGVYKPWHTFNCEIEPKGQVRIWKKAILPKGSFALVIFYTNVSGGPKKVSIKLTDLHFTTAGAYKFTEVFSGKNFGIYKPWYTLDCEVNPTGVLFFNATALP